MSIIVLVGRLGASMSLVRHQLITTTNQLHILDV